MQLREWLSETTAGSVMLPRVVTVSADMTLAEAADVMIREQISGAPVVDESRACVGVLSVSDCARAEVTVAEDTARVTESLFWSSNLILPADIYDERLAKVRDKLIPAADQPVRRFMTTNLVQVQEDDPLAKVVRAMVDAHVHRVMVVDEEGQLRGVVSTTDIMAAMLYASEPSG